MQGNIQEQHQSKGVLHTPSKTISETKTNALSACAKCGAELPEEARFCPECSAPVNQQICPKCGTENSGSADICQVCHTWLLEGKCKFCYAELPSKDAGFCPECGKPQEGIPCPNCGNLSTFDFCSKCGKPVTEEAVAEMQAAAQTATPIPDNTQEAAKIEEELAELETIINSEPEITEEEDEPEVVEQEPVRKSLFSDRQIASILQTGADIDEANRKREEAARIAEEKRLAAEAKRKAEEEERQRKIREAEAQKEALRKKQEQQRLAAIAARKATVAESWQNANRRFNSHQQARSWHIAWHKAHPGAIGWLCNYTHTVHLYSNGGPNECGDAGQGGCDYFDKPVWGRNDYGYENWVPR